MLEGSKKADPDSKRSAARASTLFPSRQIDIFEGLEKTKRTVNMTSVVFPTRQNENVGRPEIERWTLSKGQPRQL